MEVLSLLVCCPIELFPLHGVVNGIQRDSKRQRADATGDIAVAANQDVFEDIKVWVPGAPGRSKALHPGPSFD